MQAELEPDPLFVERLEWQVRTALRRESRFARPARPSFARWRVAALVVASIALGAGGVVASEAVQQSRERELLARRAEIALELARARLARAEEAAEHARAMRERGFASDADARRAETARVAAEGALLRGRLELQEVLASSRPASDAIDAPLVRGRDFAGERMEIELAELRDVRADLAAETERVKKLVEAGYASGSDLDRARSASLAAESELDAKERLFALRRSFTRGAVDELDAPRLAARIEAEGRLAVARSRAEIAERRAAEAEAGAAAGSLDARSLASARAELEEARAAVEQGELELELFERPQAR